MRNCHLVGWLACAFIGGACDDSHSDAPPARANHALPPAPPPLQRTHQLAEQKVASLKRYNKEIPLQELSAYFQQSFGVHLNEESAAALDQMLTEAVTDIWSAASGRQKDGEFVSSQAMTDTLDQLYPHETLPNADVVVLPNSTRLVVSEPLQDFFRDTAKHWSAISGAIDRLSPEKRSTLKELDPYAAEVLSEFVSVLGVAVIRLSAQKNFNHWISAAMVRSAHRNIAEAATGSRAQAPTPKATARFSEATKQRLLTQFQRHRFTDVSQAWGVTHAHVIRTDLRRMGDDLSSLGISGSGVSAEDFDGDGYIDLFFAGTNLRLYRNVKGTRFENVTEAMGLSIAGDSSAGYFIDFDNDGDQDLFITSAVAPNKLYEQRSGKFVDVTARMGLPLTKMTTHGAAWFDANADGLLDVYLGNFGQWWAGVVPNIGRDNQTGQPNRLYLQRVSGFETVFEDVTADAGVGDTGWTQAVGVLDYDQDGKPDLVSLNDFGSSRVYRNLGDGKFTEVSGELHLDTSYHAMNFTLFDLNEDGHQELYVSEVTALMHRQRYRRPSEQTAMVLSRTGLDSLRIMLNNKLYQRGAEPVYRDVVPEVFEPASLGWAWDASVLDAENDGDPDMLVLNGTEYAEDTQETGITYFSGTANVFYASEGGYFYDVSRNVALAFEGNSRGSAFADFDRDGDIDIAVSNYGAPPKVFRNDLASKNGWLELRLEGKSSNRDAVGARVVLKVLRTAAAPEQRFHRVVVASSGFLSQAPRILHFGLGTLQGPLEAEIIWPSGKTQVVPNLELNTRYCVTEGESKTVPL